MEGYIKLHRRIILSDIYVMPPLYLRIFERMIIEANHRCNRIPYKNTTKLIRRGERLTSVRQIAEWVGWYERGIFKTPNPKTVKKILDWLVDNGMIKIYNEGNRTETHYIIVNYSDYQYVDSIKVTEKKQKVNSRETVGKQSVDTNNNDNNIITTTITVIGDEPQEDENQNPVTLEDADSFKQDETDEDILTKLNSLEEDESPVDKIERHYAANVLNRTNVSQKDMEAIVGIFKEGYPVDFIIKCIDEATERYKKNNDGTVAIHSFKYFIPSIKEEWKKLKLKEAAEKISPSEPPKVDISKINTKTNNTNSNNYNYGNKSKNRFHNFKQRPIQYSNDELKKKLGIKK